MKRKKTFSPTVLFRALWQEGFFGTRKQITEIAEYIAAKGYHFRSSSHLTLSLLRVMQSEGFLTRKRTDGQWTYVQSRPPVSSAIRSAEAELFDDALIKRLGTAFEREIEDLHLNFGKSGNCSAFLLRKILEKLIYVAFARKGMETKLEDKTKSGRLIGLETMIDTAAREKVNGVPFLTHKTAQEIRGIKFLGDASAHNPLADVDMKTIIPQMPFIVTAYKELAHHL